jgi:hypothetical protein
VSLGEEAFRKREEDEWRERRSKMSMLLDDTDAVVGRAEFAGLLEYSRSLPSGTYFGKIWKRSNADGTWALGEYFDDGTPGMVAIRWRRLHVVGP